MEKSSKKSLYRKNFREKAISIGARHKGLRSELGLTIVQIAEKFKIGKTTISNCERGIQEFPLSYIVEFTNEFGISLSYLVDGKEGREYTEDQNRPVTKVSDQRKKTYAKAEKDKLEEVLKALQDDSDLLETVWHLIKAKQGIKKYHSGQ